MLGKSPTDPIDSKERAFIYASIMTVIKDKEKARKKMKK